MATSNPLPPGFSPPLAVVTANGKTGNIAILNIIGLVLVIVSTGVRVRIRFSPTQSKAKSVGPTAALGPDDVACFMATAFCIIQSSLVFYALSRGLGKSIDLIAPHSLPAIQKTVYASDVFYILALFFSKCSVILLMVRINHPRPARVFKVGLAICAVWMVSSIFLSTLRCNLAHPWAQYNTRCSGLLAHWAVIETTSMLTEVLVVGLAVHLTSSLDMRSSHKLHIVTLFGSRLIVLAFAILHLDNLPYYFASNPTLRGIPALIWTQVELDYSIAAVTIPCGKRFIAQFNTHYGRLEQSTIEAAELQSLRASREYSHNISPIASVKQPPAQPTPPPAPPSPSPPPSPISPPQMIRGGVTMYDRRKRGPSEIERGPSGEH